MLELKNIRMVTLSENSTINPFTLAEWGLSIYVEVNEQKILFDTGAGYRNLITHNADVLGVDLTQIDSIVLSHGHQDHSGGLKSVLERIKYQGNNKKVDVFCHPQALEELYVNSPPSQEYWYFGLSHSVRELEQFGGRFKTSVSPVWLTQDVIISGEIPMTNSFESIGENFGVKKNGIMLKDTEMIDDQALYLRTERGLIIVLGCAHRGIINTVHHAQKVTNIEKVYMIVGGTHLADVSEYRMSSTVAELKRLGVNKLGVSHCTGMKEASYLLSVFGAEIFFFNNVGTIISHI